MKSMKFLGSKGTEAVIVRSRERGIAHRTQITFSPSTKRVPARHNDVSLSRSSPQSAFRVRSRPDTCQYSFGERSTPRNTDGSINIFHELITTLHGPTTIKCIVGRVAAFRKVLRTYVRSVWAANRGTWDSQRMHFTCRSSSRCALVDRDETWGCRKFYRCFIAASLFRNSPQRAKYLTRPTAEPSRRNAINNKFFWIRARKNVPGLQRLRAFEFWQSTRDDISGKGWRKIREDSKVNVIAVLLRTAYLKTWNVTRWIVHGK